MFLTTGHVSVFMSWHPKVSNQSEEGFNDLAQIDNFIAYCMFREFD